MLAKNDISSMVSMGMKVAGFIKTSLLDWDGNIVSTVYLPGCNFRCPFCHNPGLVGGVADDELIEWSQVEEYLRENRDFLDGVVVSGGEPTLHPDLVPMLKAIKALGLKVKLDSNGTRPEVLDDLIGAGLIDFVAMDIKAPLDHRYDQLCGIAGQADKVRESVKVVIGSGVDHEFRTTVVPIMIKEEDVEDIARSLKGARRYVLQQFRPKVTLDPNLGALDPYAVSVIRKMSKIAGEHVNNVRVRGV